MGNVTAIYKQSNNAQGLPMVGMLKLSYGRSLPKNVLLVNRYTGIKGADERTFDWNPCTPFDNGDCKQVLVSLSVLRMSKALRWYVCVICTAHLV